VISALADSVMAETVATPTKGDGRHPGLLR